jgi:hypothetical protein
MVMKVAKIVSCFPYTHYRSKSGTTNAPNSYETWCKLIELLIQSECDIDPGVDLDLILYYRYLPESEIGKEFLYQYNGKSINRGTIHVYDMPNDHTMGFSSILEFLERDSSGYDYMIFQEDDIHLVPGCDQYVKQSIEMIQNNQCNIVAYSVHIPVLPGKPHGTQHVGGAFALYPISPLLQHLNGFPLHKQTQEVPVSQWFIKILGNRILNLPEYSSGPINFKSIPMYQTKSTKPYVITTSKYLYKLGL